MSNSRWSLSNFGAVGKIIATAAFSFVAGVLIDRFAKRRSAPLPISAQQTPAKNVPIMVAAQPAVSTLSPDFKGGEPTALSSEGELEDLETSTLPGGVRRKTAIHVREEDLATSVPSAAGNVPEDANEDCPGVGTEKSGKSTACDGCPNQDSCASGETSMKEDPAVHTIRTRLSQVRHKLLVLSGKGGVGKSTTSMQLAFGLEAAGYSVGVMDVDICGPSIPRLAGVVGADIHMSGDGWTPIYVTENLCVMSIGFLLPDEDDAIIWRGPKKNGLIKQFLTEVVWGELDFLIVDTPPGTSDEHLSIVSLMKEAGIDGALVVTTPQEVAIQDVRKEITFCKKVGVKVIGVLENMSGGVFVPTTGGAEAMCKKMEVPFAGKLTMHKSLVLACEEGVKASGEDTKKEIDDLVGFVLEGTQATSPTARK